MDRLCSLIVLSPWAGHHLCYVTFLLSQPEAQDLCFLSAHEQVGPDQAEEKETVESRSQAQVEVLRELRLQQELPEDTEAEHSEVAEKEEPLDHPDVLVLRS